MSVVNVFEKDSFLKRRFEGLLALSNPKYGLYKSPGTDPSIGETGKKAGVKAQWNYLMDCFPRYLDKNISILDIAITHDLPFNEVYDYALKFKKKGLVDIISVKP